MPPLLPIKPTMAGQKRPSFLPAAGAGASPPRKKLFRPASAPCLPALSSAAKKLAPPRPAPPSSAAARPRPPPPPASKKSAQQRPAEAEAAPCRAVHPTRRLACGTAVIVRTRLPLLPARCGLLVWLPARVVSSSDAYHCTVKYAAYLHADFAGKIVRVPASHVRPHRSSSSAAAAAKADHAKRP